MRKIQNCQKDRKSQHEEFTVGLFSGDKRSKSNCNGLKKNSRNSGSVMEEEFLSI